MTDAFVTGLVLGAGGSKRLGRPSSCCPIGDGTLLGHVVGVARACAFDQLVVAIGGAADDVREAVDLTGADVVVNDAYGEGCSSSIAAALGAVDLRCDVLVLMLGDQPGVTAETVRALLAGRGDAPLAVCRYDDGRGHPIAFARSDVRRAGRPARRQGRLAAARPARRRGRRGADRRARSRSTSTREEDYVAGDRRRRQGELAHLVPDVETLAQRLAGVDYLVDEGLATSMFLGAAPAAAAAARGRGGRRQDRGGASRSPRCSTPR